MNIYILMFLCILITAGIMETIREIVVKRLDKQWQTKLILIPCGLIISILTVSLGLYGFYQSEFNFMKVFFYGFVVYFLQKDVTLEVLKPIIQRFKDRV